MKIFFKALFLCVFLAAGCRKDTTVILKDIPVVVTKVVSFSKDIVPVFSKSCALSGCHGAGSYAPILMDDQAYSSLINGSGYIDTKNPAGSILYERLTGGLSPAMPLGGPNNPSNINALVLAWIKQGAKKN
jgi:hypothetical protein